MESEGSENKQPAKRRVFEAAFKVSLVRRLLEGEKGTALSRECQIPRSMLYRWRNLYLQQGPAGLERPVGRPPRIGRLGLAPPPPGDPAAQQLAELQRKVGQQALEIDFLRRAFKRVKRLEEPGGGSGASGSTAKSAPGSALKDNSPSPRPAS
jgi:transposase-like protein